MNKNISSIRSEEINGALQAEYRQYLTGILSRPQVLKHINSDIEIGISYYDSYKAEIPHKHPVATEYGYVLSGFVKILMLEGEKKEECFKEGDFFVIENGNGYACKNAPGTKVLFIKAPGGNDKICIDAGEELKEWMEKW